jgi:hypothetical protein
VEAVVLRLLDTVAVSLHRVVTGGVVFLLDHFGVGLAWFSYCGGALVSLGEFRAARYKLQTLATSRFGHACGTHRNTYATHYFEDHNQEAKNLTSGSQLDVVWRTYC